MGKVASKDGAEELQAESANSNTKAASATRMRDKKFFVFKNDIIFCILAEGGSILKITPDKVAEHKRRSDEQARRFADGSVIAAVSRLKE